MGQGIFVGICGMIRGHEHPGIKGDPHSLDAECKCRFYVFRLQSDMGELPEHLQKFHLQWCAPDFPYLKSTKGSFQGDVHRRPAPSFAKLIPPIGMGFFRTSSGTTRRISSWQMGTVSTFSAVKGSRSIIRSMVPWRRSFASSLELPSIR